MLRSAVKHAIRLTGFELKRYSPPPPEYSNLAKMLLANRVNLVFDVGANNGQFAMALRTAGYAGRIVSFEPVRDAWQKLQEASPRDPLWEIADRGAIGARDSEISIHVARDTQCSSVLDTLDAVNRITSEAVYVGSEQVPLQKLDSIGPRYLRPDSVLFIKADVQGFEDQVLKGATELLKKTVGLHLEMSLVPLYEGQPLYHDLINVLEPAGFRLWDFKPEYFDRENGRMVWGCGTFFRT